MKDKDINYDFNHIFPKYIRDDFLFSLDTYRLFLEGLSITPSAFYQKWSDVNVLSIIDKYWKKELTPELKEQMVTQPLIVYPTKEDTKRTLMLSPNKVYKFQGGKGGVSPPYAQEKTRFIMKNYVLTPGNVGTIKYRDNDLVIINNRKVMHTSSPTDEYNEYRYFTLLFLGTKSPFLSGTESL